MSDEPTNYEYNRGWADAMEVRRARIEALEAALAFYAKHENWTLQYDEQFRVWTAPAHDEGRRARAALPHP